MGADRLRNHPLSYTRPMAIEILALPSDRWDDYRALRLEALRTEPQAFGASCEENLGKPEAYWRGRLEDSEGLLLFAQMEGRLVGMVGAFPSGEDGLVELISLYVIPSERGHGVAHALLAAVLGALQASGTYRRVRLAVNEMQTAALALYERWGFVPEGAMEARMGDGKIHQERILSRPISLSP